MLSYDDIKKLTQWELKVDAISLNFTKPEKRKMTPNPNGRLLLLTSMFESPTRVIALHIAKCLTAKMLLSGLSEYWGKK